MVRSQDSVQSVYPKISEELSVPGFKKHVLMDLQTLKQLEEGYKGRLTENARLTKAARLAAK